MHSRLTKLSQSAKGQQAVAAAAFAARRMTAASRKTPVHAPRAGKVGDPLVVGETTAGKLDRAKGVCVCGMRRGCPAVSLHPPPPWLCVRVYQRVSAHTPCGMRHAQQSVNTHRVCGRDETWLSCSQHTHRLPGCPAGYPYPRPPTSFVFVNGPSSSTGPAAFTFDNAAWVPPSRWHGSLDSLNSLEVTGPDGHTQQ